MVTDTRSESTRRLESFLLTLGAPQLSMPAVHVTGTNGRSSVAMMLTRILHRSGIRVGTILPHAIGNTSLRVLFEGRPLPRREIRRLNTLMDRTDQIWRRQRGKDFSRLTDVEELSAAAFFFFAQFNTDLLVVASTPSADPSRLTRPLITTIPCLGPSSWQDAESLMAHRQLGEVTAIGNVSQSAASFVKRATKRVRTEVLSAGEELGWKKSKKGWTFTIKGLTLEDVSLAMDGEHQAANAAVALTAVGALLQRGYRITGRAIREGLAEARLRGRREEIAPGLMVDMASSLPAMESLAALVKARKKVKKRTLVATVGEDPVTLLAPLAPLFDQIVIPGAHRGAAARALSAKLAELKTPVSMGKPLDGVLADIYRNSDETLVVGSPNVVADAMGIVTRDEDEVFAKKQAS